MEEINKQKELHKKNQIQNQTIPNETDLLIERKEKLITILGQIKESLNDETNKNEKIDYFFNQYNKKEKNKEKIINKYDKNCHYFMFFVAGIFVTINLVGIFTLKSVMDSLFEVFKNSFQYFLLKKSDLEEKELTDFESRFNSSYNFYEQFFNDISNNKIDFDIIMFWDIIGSLFYEYFNFICTSIFFFLINVALLAFIAGFDIDEKAHKYSFFQVLSI